MISKTNFRKPFLICLLVSLLLHVFCLVIGWKGAFFFAGRDRPLSKPEIVEVDLKDGPYQIADIPEPANEKRPGKAKFAGLYDSSVEEEQVVASPRPQVAHKGRKGSSKVSEQSHRRIHSAMAGGANGEIEDKPMRGSGREQDLSPTSNGLPGDFFPDYKVGDKTYLNVLRFPKVGYFVRLKKIFNTTWNPRSSLMASNLVSRGQVSVKLAVAIDGSGRLAELRVINSSGLDSYDNEALRTIHASSPFAAPPADLLNGLAELRMVWTFTVYL